MVFSSSGHIIDHLSPSARERNTPHSQSFEPSPSNTFHWSREGDVATSEPVVEILVDYFWCQSIGLTHFRHIDFELKMNGFPSKLKRLLKEDDRWILSRQKQQLSTLQPITIFFSMPFDAIGQTPSSLTLWHSLSFASSLIFHCVGLLPREIKSSSTPSTSPAVYSQYPLLSLPKSQPSDE